MSIEYVLDFGCPVKEALTQERLVALVKTRGQAQGLLEMLRERGDTRPAHEIKVSRRRHTPRGDADSEEQSVQDMIDGTAELNLHEPTCEGCAANACRRPFGCYGSVNYPIRVTTERWLLERLPDNLGSPVGHLLRRACRDFGYDGGPFRKMRGDPMFFEQDEPLACSWPLEDGGAWPITANIVLQMLFGVGHLEPAHCVMTLWFLGALPHTADPSELGGFAGLKQLLSETEIPFASDDPQVNQVIRFCGAMRAAALLDATLLIDM
ncbi:MAG: hypothetical protein K2V38_05300 [Gemmataceae bacterium]|nr:hypothetical protein [Gemmataceae bacterium]